MKEVLNSLLRSDKSEKRRKARFAGLKRASVIQRLIRRKLYKTERDFLSNVVEQNPSAVDMLVASTLFRTMIPIIGILICLVAGFVFSSNELVHERTKWAILPFLIAIVVTLAVALLQLRAGHHKLAKNMAVVIAASACLVAVFLTGGPLLSVASPILIVLPIIFMCFYQTERGVIVAVLLPIFGIIADLVIRSAGFSLPNFTSYASQEFNVIAVLSVTYGIVTAAVWGLLLSNRGLRNQIEIEGRHFFDLSRRDNLTRLPNRYMFSETMDHTLDKLDSNEKAALVFLDLDHFKTVNDTLGHPVGDKLLQQVASRIENLIQDDEMLARLGGDEFALIISGSRVAQIEKLTSKLVEEMRQPFTVDGHTVTTGVSVGVAIAPDHGASAEKLLKNSDLALYEAKAKGRNQVSVFEPGLDLVASERRAIEQDLRKAVSRGELVLHYQPVIDLSSGRTVVYEALVRWKHPTRGMVWPDVFIGIAEESGLIVGLGDWVIRQALSDIAKWDDEVHVAINLSPAQMSNPNLANVITQALAHSGISPDRVELEITEGILMRDSETNIQTLHMLRNLGLRISLDDFGTGFSSLNYLRSFPFDKIKIDRNFVHEIDNNRDCRAIIRSVIELAHSLDMETTAEGVEREEQVKYLKREGCDQAQGFLYGKAKALVSGPNQKTTEKIRPLSIGKDQTEEDWAGRRKSTG